MDEVEYLLFPRLPGYAEIGWSQEKGRSWEEYRVRLGKQEPRFKAMKINFYQSKKVPWVE
jgi:hexosaminidase